MTDRLSCIFDSSHTAQVRDFVHPEVGIVLRALYCEQCGKAALPTVRTDGSDGGALLDLQQWKPLTVVRVEWHCEHCGKPERFNVLCPDCEQLACECCGRVECCCESELVKGDDP